MSAHEPDAEMLRRMLPLVDPDSHPVPDDILRVAEGLFLWKSVAADLAVLESSGATALTGVRGSVATTRLSCTLPGGSTEIEIEYFAAERLLVVDVGDVATAGVRLTRLDGEAQDVETAPDVAGICRFVVVDPGRIFLVFRREDGAPVKTEPLLLA